MKIHNLPVLPYLPNRMRKNHLLSSRRIQANNRSSKKNKSNKILKIQQLQQCKISMLAQGLKDMMKRAMRNQKTLYKQKSSISIWHRKKIRNQILRLRKSHHRFNKLFATKIKLIWMEMKSMNLKRSGKVKGTSAILRLMQKGLHLMKPTKRPFKL